MGSVGNGYLLPLGHIMWSFKLDIEERHAYYLNNISSGMMPISLKTAKYLYDLCRDRQPRYILDSGSGFSSYVFRLYKFNSPSKNIRVITIDNSKVWLAKTRKFIRESGITPEDCYDINTFNEYSDLFKFDIIFEDYNINYRSQRFKYDLAAIKKSGIIIVDDAHLDKVSAIIGPQVRRNNISVTYLKKLKDNYGRYPAIVRR